MGYSVPSVDMSTFSVGQEGVISLNSTLAKISYDPSTVSQGLYAHIRIFNESGSVLQIWDDTGSIDDYVPAGAWPTYRLDPTATNIYFKVIGLMTGPKIQLLLCSIYAPGETVPDTPQLGNSPIGGTTTTVGNTLSNEGGAIGVLVIDIGDLNFADLIKILTDGSAIWFVDQSGTKHQVVSINTSGNQIVIGQSGDVAEVVSKLQIDSGIINKSSTNNIIDASGSADVYYKSFGGNMNFQNDGANTRFQVTSTGPNITSGNYYSCVAGSISRLNGSVTSCSSGTVISHGLGATPDWYGGIPGITQPGSATLGVLNGGSSTFTATIGAGTLLCWVVGKVTG